MVGAVSTRRFLRRAAPFLHFPLDKFQEPLREPSLTGSKSRVYAAQKAVALAPDHPPNQLALAEALARSGRRAEARAAYEHALVLARSRVAAGDPDAPEWVAEAERGLR